LGFLHIIGQKISKLYPETDTNVGLLSGTPAQVSVCLSGCFAQFNPQRIKAWNKVVTRDGTHCLLACLFVCLFVFLALQPIVVVFSRPSSGL
jgi:hypothetical protein